MLRRKSLNRYNLYFFTYFVSIFFLFFSQLTLANDVYYRFDTRSPDEIKMSNGFIPKGDDTLVLNHVMDTHPQGESGYVSFTLPTGIPALSDYFYEAGQRNIWLYHVEVPYQMLSTQNMLRNTFQNQVSLFRSLFDPDFPAEIDPLEFDSNYTYYNTHFGTSENAESFLATMFTTTSGLAIYQDQLEQVHSGRLDYRYIVRAEYIQLLGNGEYRTLQTRELNPVQVQGNEPPTPSNATHFLVDVNDYTESQRTILLQNNAVDSCTFSSSSKKNRSINNQNCAPYVNKVMVPRLFVPRLKFLTDKTYKWLSFGDVYSQWLTHDQAIGKDRDHCGVEYIEDRSNYESYCFTADSKGDYSSNRKYKTIISNFGLADGGRGYADINGDGRKDLCRLIGLPTYALCSLSDGKGFNKDLKSNKIDAGYANQRWWVDVNGDGVDDFCRITGTGMSCSLGKKQLINSSINMFSDTISFFDDIYGQRETQKFVDIIGDKSHAFCRLINNSTKMRCNYFDKSTKTFKKIESKNIDGGAPYYRYWAKYDGRPGMSFCRSVDGNNYKTFRCLSYDRKHGFIDNDKFTISETPYSWRTLKFVDLFNRGIDDLCVVNVNNIFNCYVYKGKNKFSEGFSSKQAIPGIGNFISGEQHIMGLNAKTKTGKYCRYIGWGELRCFEFKK